MLTPWTETVGDLQSDVVLDVFGGVFTGTSKYVESLDTFDMDDGHNFFVPKFTAAEGATITVEQIGGKSGPVTLDSDGLIIVQMTTDPCVLEVKATLDDIVETKRYLVALERESE